MSEWIWVIFTLINGHGSYKLMSAFAGKLSFSGVWIFPMCINETAQSIDLR